MSSYKFIINAPGARPLPEDTAFCDEPARGQLEIPTVPTILPAGARGLVTLGTPGCYCYLCSRPTVTVYDRGSRDLVPMCKQCYYSHIVVSQS